GGAKDDVSTWAGVNDGYHWKSTIPMGRYTLIVTPFLFAGLLLSSLWLPKRFMLPISGIVLCLGAALGCSGLMYPGHVPDRNMPLGIVVLAGLVGAILLTISLARSIRL
ncbi:MAG: hypothetical protein R3242_10595, partial [Akkermansiaceae bacterium]|nr:hypothetical protein [Akkermansiaceae bacterium]